MSMSNKPKSNPKTNISQEPTMFTEIEREDYYGAIKKFLDEWDEVFRDYDFNDYLYEEQENTIYGIVDKFYTRTRRYQSRIPKELKHNVPSLRQLDKNFMYEDNDSHLSDYEAFITDRLRKLYKERHIHMCP